MLLYAMRCLCICTRAAFPHLTQVCAMSVLITKTCRQPGHPRHNCMETR